jgi:hypothetical protein
MPPFMTAYLLWPPFLIVDYDTMEKSTIPKW